MLHTRCMPCLCYVRVYLLYSVDWMLLWFLYSSFQLVSAALHQIILQNSFWPHPGQVISPDTWDFGQKQCCEIVNVIVIVPVTWSEKINLSMSSTSYFKVHIEKLEGLDDLALMGMTNFNASACLFPRRHHWWISKVPACRCTASAEKGTKWVVTRWCQSCKHYCMHAKQVCCRAHVDLHQC